MEKIAIIAGKGRLPEAIGKELVRKNYQVHIIGIINFVDKLLYGFTEYYREFKLGQIKKIIDYLKTNEIRKIIIAGKVEHINIFKDINPDMYALSLMKKLPSKDFSSIFETIKEFLKEHSIELIGYDTILSPIIPEKEILSGEPDKNIMKDIKKGYRVAKKIADLGIGQSIAIKEGVILAVEGIEGTDKMIERAGLYSNDFIIVKVSMPEQDMRLDIPVVGLNTVKKIEECGGVALVIEAKKTIVLDFNEVMEYCKKTKLILVAI